MDPICSVTVFYTQFNFICVVYRSNNFFLMFSEISCWFKTCIGYLVVKFSADFSAFLSLMKHSVISDAYLHFLGFSILFSVFTLKIKPVSVSFFIKYFAFNISVRSCITELFNLLFSHTFHNIPYGLTWNIKSCIFRNGFSCFTKRLITNHFLNILAYYFIIKSDRLGSNCFVEKKNVPVFHCIVIYPTAVFYGSEFCFNSGFAAAFVSVSFSVTFLHQLFIKTFKLFFYDQFSAFKYCFKNFFYKYRKFFDFFIAYFNFICYTHFMVTRFLCFLPITF